MPKRKKTCPFTDNSCKACRALFAEEESQKSDKKLVGCHLAKNAGKEKDRR